MLDLSGVIRLSPCFRLPEDGFNPTKMGLLVDPRVEASLHEVLHFVTLGTSLGEWVQYRDQFGEYINASFWLQRAIGKLAPIEREENEIATLGAEVLCFRKVGGFESEDLFLKVLSRAFKIPNLADRVEATIESGKAESDLTLALEKVVEWARFVPST